MKVKMLVQLDAKAPPNIGDEVDVDKAKAVAFIQAGYAAGVPAPVEAIKTEPTRADIEGELTALGVSFIRGADLPALSALLVESRPEPRDGDGDGNVLDGTPAERPKRKTR